jgi:hypothetical protein
VELDFKFIIWLFYFWNHEWCLCNFAVSVVAVLVEWGCDLSFVPVSESIVLVRFV